MFSKRNLTLTLSLLFVTIAFGMSAHAQIDKVTLHLDAFLCDSVCVNTISHVLKNYDEVAEDVLIDPKTRTATVYPNPKKSLDLWEIRRELRNAERVPWKIEVVLTGEVVEYTKVYSGGEARPRKALKIKGTNQRFILMEDAKRDELIESGLTNVTIFGEIPAFGEKNLPILVIKDFTKTKEQKEASQADAGRKAKTATGT